MLWVAASLVTVVNNQNLVVQGGGGVDLLTDARYRGDRGERVG